MSDRDISLQRGLKIVIAIMTLMIVVALMAIAYRIVNPSGSAKTARVSVTAGAPAFASDVPLPSGASVKSMALDGDRLVLYYEGPSGGGLTVVDLATGRPLSRLRLTPETPR